MFEAVNREVRAEKPAFDLGSCGRETFFSIVMQVLGMCIEKTCAQPVRHDRLGNHLHLTVWLRAADGVAFWAIIRFTKVEGEQPELNHLGRSCAGLADWTSAMVVLIAPIHVHTPR